MLHTNNHVLSFRAAKSGSLSHDLSFRAVRSRRRGRARNLLFAARRTNTARNSSLRMNSPSDSRPAILFRHVSYSLNGGGELLRNLSLEIREGETLVLLGKSGSGKTTT